MAKAKQHAARKPGAGRRRLIILGAAAAVLAVAAGVWIIFFPNRGADANHVGAGPTTACGTPIPLTTLQHYTIIPAQSTATYTAHENLILGGVGSNSPVGKTHNVQGSLYLGTSPSPLVANVTITVDLSTLQTDSIQRDNYVRQNSLQTDQYPDAVFTSTCVTGLPATYSDGQMIAFQLTGNLAMHGKVNQETFAVQGQLHGTTLTGTATTSIFMTDFGITPPNLANVAIADNKVALAFTFTAQQG
jgi:polyisoprenoid-binding protein YceI